MVYLAELLVVTFDQLKIARIHARNVPHAHGHKRLDDDASSRLSLHESDGVTCSMTRGAVLLKHKKSSPDNLLMSGSAVASKQESCRDSMPSSL